MPMSSLCSQAWAQVAASAGRPAILSRRLLTDVLAVGGRAASGVSGHRWPIPPMATPQPDTQVKWGPLHQEPNVEMTVAGFQRLVSRDTKPWTVPGRLHSGPEQAACRGKQPFKDSWKEIPEVSRRCKWLVLKYQWGFPRVSLTNCPQCFCYFRMVFPPPSLVSSKWIQPKNLKPQTHSS